MSTYINLTLPGDTRCLVSVTIIAEPRFPTPGEPEIRREPTLSEWMAIIQKLSSGDFRAAPTFQGSPAGVGRGL